MISNRFLYTVLATKAALFMLFIALGPIGLAPDEAQYWTWSQNLDWGYYSKPPGIAWQIWLGTLFFGNTELGVRFGAVLLSIVLPLVVYRLGRRVADSEEVGLWAAIGLALSPLGFLSSLLAITDTGMALFWTLACIEMVSTQPPRYVLVGLFIALGALFKWPIYAFWFLVWIAMFFFPQIRSKHAIGGFVISLVGLLPSLYWNQGHDWATVRHVIATIIGQQVQSGSATIPVKGNFLDFFAAQAGLMSPLLFAFFGAGAFYTIKKWKSYDFRLKWLVISSLGMLLFCLFLALFKKIQGNWVSYIYPSAFVVAAWFCFKRWEGGRIWYPIGVIVSLALSIGVFMIPWLQENGGRIPYKFSPFRHNVGWNHLHEALLNAGYDPETMFLFADKYQNTSLLSFYGPGQKRAYFLNLLGTRKNQFSYWPSMREEQIGRPGYFVAVENGPDLSAKLDKQVAFYDIELKKYFNHISLVKIIPLFIVGDSMEKAALIYKGDVYNGNEILENQLY